MTAEFNDKIDLKGLSSLVGEDIIVFANDWKGDPLSKIHLIRILARENRILWVNSIGSRTPTVSSKDISRAFGKVKSFLTNRLEAVEPNIFVLSPLAVPVYDSRVVQSLNARWLERQIRTAMRELHFGRPVHLTFNPSAGILARKLNEKLLIYYCVDEFSAFTGVSSEAMLASEAELMRAADLVVVSAENLLSTKKGFNRNTQLVRHGTDWAHFSKALDDATIVPEELAKLPKPIIGFHGLLADWVDYELIKKIAERLSGGSVVLVGKIALDAEQKVKILDDVTNVHFLGRKPYADLPAYCKGFDVAINPFILNELTLAANPLKVREYIAAGLVAVSTDIPEVRDLEWCVVGRDHAEFLSELLSVLEKRVDRTTVSKTMKSESWESRVEMLRRLVTDTKCLEATL